MKQNFNTSFEKLLQSEGGFVNHPSDPGGATNMGVTQRVWEEWMGHAVDTNAMKRLTPAMVKPLYKRKYWDKVSGDDLPSGLDYCVFDAAVNSGPGRAVKWLQQILGVTQDGVIGPKTLAAIRASNLKQVIAQYNDMRLSFLKELPTWGVFGKGWERRVTEVRHDAATMIA